MTLSNAEGRRMIKQKGGLWLDRWDDSDAAKAGDCTIYDRLEKIWPYLDGEYVELKAGWVICVGKTIDKAVCARIIAGREEN